MALLPQGRNVRIASGQTTAGDTNIMDRGNAHWQMPAVVVVTTTIGGSPTATFAILGSIDNVNFFPIPYADSATPGTITSATFSQNTATTSYKFLQAVAWRYLKVTLSTVNNVTSTIDVGSGD